MGTPDKGPFFGVAKGLALVTELGLSTGVPIALGALVGSYLDERYGGRGLIFVVVFLLGLAAGLYSGYRLLRYAVELNK
ncbi:MAG: AtpZ/AtpI family protein [Candidatus Hydrogenedentes bacterium]|nr:AtpZ/AtpI family protein [Candidatus Hydrogenedentota bacterium]